MNSIEKLRKLGMNEKEIKLYLTLLKHGKSTPTSLSKLTRINRATVYHLAKGLIGRGLVAEDHTHTVLHFAPLPPENLERIIEDGYRELKNKEQLVKGVISSLNLLNTSGVYPVPKFRFVEEQNLEKFLYDNTAKWNKELLRTDGTWWGFQDHSLVEHFEEWILWCAQTKEYKDVRIQAKLLSNDSLIEEKVEKKIMKTKRNVRFVANMDFTSTIWIAGDYVVMISTRQHPFYLFELHDAALAHNLRETFNKLWSFTS